MVHHRSSRDTVKQLLASGLAVALLKSMLSPTFLCNPDRCRSCNVFVAVAAQGSDVIFERGDLVKAVCPDDNKWYAGVIEDISLDDAYAVKWDDPEGGPLTHEIVGNDIRRLQFYNDYSVGEIVEALFLDDGNWYPGKVSRINDDDTFMICWDDPDGGPEESKVEPRCIKYPAIPSEKLEIGKRYFGTVNSLTDMGAFVDIGAEREGLLHVSRMSKEQEDLREGEPLEVWITDMRDDGKFGLTAVDSSDSWRRTPADLSPFAGLSPLEWQSGTVARIAPFGVFVTVTLEDGASATGLVHTSLLADAFKDLDNLVEEGQEVKVRVQSVYVGEGKMSLSMREDVYT